MVEEVTGAKFTVDGAKLKVESSKPDKSLQNMTAPCKVMTAAPARTVRRRDRKSTTGEWWRGRWRLAPTRNAAVGAALRRSGGEACRRCARREKRRCRAARKRTPWRCPAARPGRGAKCSPSTAVAASARQGRRRRERRRQREHGDGRQQWQRAA